MSRPRPTHWSRRVWALAASSVLFSCHRAPQSDLPVPPTSFSLLSYNVNYGLAGDPEGIAAIVDSEADIVLLQESNEAWEQALRSDSRVRSRWPWLQFHHCCGAGGLAVLSRWPIAQFEILEPPRAEPEAWFPALLATIERPAGSIQLLDLHLRPPVPTGTQTWLGALSQTPKVHLAEVEHYAQALEPTLPTVIAGDFNERDGGRALGHLAGIGFVDALRTLPRRHKTWRWGSLRARLDHLLVNEALELIEIEVLHVGQSDHFPLRARLIER